MGSTRDSRHQGTKKSERDARRKCAVWALCNQTHTSSGNLTSCVTFVHASDCSRHECFPLVVAVNVKVLDPYKYVLSVWGIEPRLVFVSKQAMSRL